MEESQFEGEEEVEDGIGSDVLNLEILTAIPEVKERKQLM